jgi:thioredoxin-like negative regulator of GroEL
VFIGPVAVGLALAATVAIGLVRMARDGRLRAGAADDGRHRSALRALGVEPAAPVTLVHFSTPVCAPCRAVRRVCADAAARLDGVTTLEVDVDTHLDAARALDVWRAPTVLVVGSGRIVSRAVGVPSLADLLAAAQPLVVARREARGASAASPAVANGDQQ